MRIAWCGRVTGLRTLQPQWAWGANCYTMAQLQPAVARHGIWDGAQDAMRMGCPAHALVHGTPPRRACLSMAGRAVCVRPRTRNGMSVHARHTTAACMPERGRPGCYIEVPREVHLPQ